MDAIKKIVLDLGGVEVSLTPEQAKNLRAALDELFGKRVIREEHHHYDYYRWHWYWHSEPDIQPYRITCDPYFTGTWPSTSVAATYDNTSGTLRLTG